jgi:hypothetical protein
MKNVFIYSNLCLILLILCGSVFAQDSKSNAIQVKNLGAAQSGNSIRITWQSESENGVDYYQVFRSSSKDGPFTCIRSNVSRLGSYQMYVLDDNCDLFKTSGRILFYKVRVVLVDGSFKESVAVSTYYSSTSSTAKRTWGSIKAMFR